MSCQSLDTSHCQDGAQFRDDLGLLMRFSFGLGPGSESVESVGNEDADAQNNQKCGNSFKHQPILRNRPIERSPFCTVKEIPLGHINFPPHDDFEQHRGHGCLPQIPMEMETDGTE
jgi:hypothetical protein